ncbi:MAG: hypothetical protein GXZ00_04130 [Synergistaceae bacterium]|nr:hypothetical protein [Synergistaceae bacterium]
MKFEIPKPLKVEHEELHTELTEVIKAGGAIGEAGKEVARVLHSHFLKEEEYALPPLGLLSVLAQGQITPEMIEVLKMTDRLKAELPEMLKEHRVIVEALAALTDAAKKENKLKFVHFAEKLTLHAKTEEEVLYPAALLVGEYIKMKI